MQRRVSLSRARQIQRFIEFFDRAGAPTDRGLERNGLPVMARERPDIFVSTRAMNAFARDMASREGIDDLGWRVGSAEEPVSVLGSELAQRFYASPSLLSALRLFASLLGRESSTLALWLEEDEGSVLLCHRSPVEYALGQPHEISQARSVFLLKLVRAFAEPDWMPTEFGFVGEGGRAHLVHEALPNARILEAPDTGWLRLPRSILALPSRVQPPRDPGRGTKTVGYAATDLVGSLTQLLRPYLARSAPSIQEAADLAGTSIRSLQRDLASSGTCYRDVLLRVKLDTARDLLRQPDIRIVDVAHESGFSDQANFARFFKNCAGVSPRAYRSAHLEGCP